MADLYFVRVNQFTLH